MLFAKSSHFEQQIRENAVGRRRRFTAQERLLADRILRGDADRGEKSAVPHRAEGVARDAGRGAALGKRQFKQRLPQKQTASA